MNTAASLRRSARERLNEFTARPENVLIVHVACSDISSDPTQTRITGIAVQNFATREVHEFGDSQEREILRRYFEFVAFHRDRNWAHYDMGGPTYGFRIIRERGKQLGLPVEVPPPERCLDIKGAIQDIYGEDFAPHPRLNSLLLLNGYQACTVADIHSVAWAIQRVDDLGGVLHRILKGTLVVQGKYRKDAKPSRKRGGQQKYDPKFDRRIAEAWDTKRYSTKAELAREKGLSPADIEKALNRYRKREKKSESSC